MTWPPSRLIAEWQGARAAVAELERAAHPDIVDHHGRAWAWWKGDLYRHCGMAWPRAMVEDATHGLPSEAARTNPNYSFCGTCGTR